MQASVICKFPLGVPFRGFGTTTIVGLRTSAQNRQLQLQGLNIKPCSFCKV